MLSRSIYLNLALGITILCSSCGNDPFMNSGKTITRIYPIENKFSLLELKSSFDIYLIQDSLNCLEITCGENLQNYINIISKKDTLWLSHNLCDEWSRDYQKIKIAIHFNNSLSINAKAPTKLRNKDTLVVNSFGYADYFQVSDVSLTIKTNSFNLGVSPQNFGYFILNGSTNNFNCWIRGSSIIDAKNLKIMNCSMRHQGIGNLYFNVRESISGSLESTGNVYLLNEPDQINIKKESSGNIFYLK